jgi:hypothetical protein
MIHVVPVDPMPGRRLDIAAYELVLPKGRNQLLPVSEGNTYNHPLLDRTAALAREQAHTSATIAPLLLKSGHSSDTSIRFDALLKLLVDLNYGISNLVDVIALPWSWQQDLTAPAPASPRSDVQPRMTSVIQNGPAPAAAPLRQGMRHHSPNRVLPITGRSHVRCLVRCLASQPGTGKQTLAEAGSPNASHSK